ncbi:MAG: hypothetical protein KH366_10550 [Clostridiaceae bacterium]|nr:hypothetical protein [Clostridiaceae bacterium]
MILLADKVKGLLSKIENQKKAEISLKESTLPGDQLLYRLCYSPPKSREGWLELHEDVHKFLQSDSPENQKQNLMQYTEMLAMIISGYDNTQD